MRSPWNMETVFSDPHGAKLDFLKECQSQGYVVTLIFISLDSADLSLNPATPPKAG